MTRRLQAIAVVASTVAGIFAAAGDTHPDGFDLK